MSALPTGVAANVDSRDNAITWITKTPGVCGGDACVRNTRISIWLLESYRRQGLTSGEILTQYPGLNETDLSLAWEYAAQHPEEIETALLENEEA